MACFLVPAAEAAAVMAAAKAAEGRGEGTQSQEEGRLPFSQKLKWLSKLLWGGSALLAFEHLWHGEVMPFFPFLAAVSDAGDRAEMLQEMGTVGVGMALAVTAVWGVMVLVTGWMEKRALPDRSAAQ